MLPFCLKKNVPYPQGKKKMLIKNSGNIFWLGKFLFNIV